MANGAVARVGERIPRIQWWPVVGLIGLGAVSGVLGPELLTTALIGLIGVTLVSVRPQFGVAIILFMLMVQYGSRQADRTGAAGLSGLIPQGSGLFSINNILGLFLAALLVYRSQTSGDWSFLKSRIVQILIAVTAVMVFSAFVSGIKVADQAAIGLVASTGEDPSRMLISRALFVVLFLVFIRTPRDLLMIVGLFVALSVITAWSGSGAAISSTGRASVGTYRAGGTDVLIASTQNPNRLGMIATLGLVYVWEYSEGFRSRIWRLAALAVVLLLVVTVFLTASRGGLIGLVFAGVMLFVRRRGGSGRWLYGLVAIAVAAALVQELVPEQALQRITNIPGLSSQEDKNSVGQGSIERREYTYGIGIQVWKKSPLVGVGPGNWSYVRYLTDPARSAAAAHNSFLQQLAEGGAIGLSLYLLLFYVTIRDILRCERDPEIIERARSEGLEWLLVATRICLLAFMVFSMFADLWDLIFSYFLLAVSAVLIQRYLRSPAAAAPVGPAGLTSGA